MILAIPRDCIGKREWKGAYLKGKRGQFVVIGPLQNNPFYSELVFLVKDLTKGII